MKDEAIKHIIDKYNLNEIVDILSNKLSGSELNSLLLEVFERRVMQETPSSLLGKYTKNSQKNGKIWINKVSVWY